jgi:4-hydroxybenzoate polyprenyltransferase
VPATRLGVERPRAATVILHALRPHQWLKNLLIFVPLVLAHVARTEAWAQAGGAFLGMCLASSGAYVVNDLIDADADRIHPTKRRRAFAAGLLSRTLGAVIAGLLLACALAVAFLVSAPVGMATLGYVGVTFVYSIWLKTILAIDVLLLAGLYCLRLQIGGLATDITISPWTLTFAMFLFVSLALMKRYAELHNARSSGAIFNGRRGYLIEDLPAIASLGCASGMTAVLVIALYVNADDIRRLYARPNLLWGICVVVMLWIMRLWLLTNRGEMHEDPVLYASRDRWSIALALAAGALLLAAI